MLQHLWSTEQQFTCGSRLHNTYQGILHKKNILHHSIAKSKCSID